MNKIELEIDDHTASRLRKTAAQLKLDPMAAARAALERGLTALDRDTILAELDEIFRNSDGATAHPDDEDLLMRESIQETKAARDQRRRGG